MPKNSRYVRQRDIRTISAEKYDGLQANSLITPDNPVASLEEAGYSIKWKSFHFRVKKVDTTLAIQFLNLEEPDLIGVPTVNITDNTSFYLVFPEVFQPHLFEPSSVVIHDESEDVFLAIKCTIRSSNYGLQFDCMTADKTPGAFPPSWNYFEIRKRVIDPTDTLKIIRAYVPEDQKLVLVFNKKINATSFAEGDLEYYLEPEGSLSGVNNPISVIIASDGLSAEFSLDVPFLAEETITLKTSEMDFVAMANDCTLLEQYDELKVENLL